MAPDVTLFPAISSLWVDLAANIEDGATIDSEETEDEAEAEDDIIDSIHILDEIAVVVCDLKG